jgi:hypothetical protein
MRTLRRIAMWEFQSRFYKLSPMDLEQFGASFWLECVLAKFPNIEIFTLLYDSPYVTTNELATIQERLARLILGEKNKQIAKSRDVRHPELRLIHITYEPHALPLKFKH